MANREEMLAYVKKKADRAELCRTAIESCTIIYTTKNGTNTKRKNLKERKTNDDGL